MLSLKFKLPSWLDDVIVNDDYGFSVPVKSFSRPSPESLFKELSSARFCSHLNICLQKWCNHNLCTPKLYTKNFK